MNAPIWKEGLDKIIFTFKFILFVIAVFSSFIVKKIITFVIEILTKALFTDSVYKSYNAFKTLKQTCHETIKTTSWKECYVPKMDIPSSNYFLV